jgi:hypothetical protein
MRSDAAFLNHRAWRRDFHDNLFTHRAHGQQTASERSKNSLSHFIPFDDRA